MRKSKKHPGIDHEAVAFTAGGRRIVVLYRPPGNFISPELMQFLRNESQGKQNFLLVGDLNVRTELQRPTPARLHNCLKYELGLHQYVSFPTFRRTRKKTEESSTVDHAWSKIPCSCVPLIPYEVRSSQESVATEIYNLPDASDHRAIHIRCPKWKPKMNPPRGRMLRQWAKVDSDEAAEIVRKHM